MDLDTVANRDIHTHALDKAQLPSDAEILQSI